MLRSILLILVLPAAAECWNTLGYLPTIFIIKRADQSIQIMSDLIEGLDDSLYKNTIKFYEPRNKQDASKALVFIHGGAWIDEKNTPNDFKQLCKTILELSNGMPRFSMYSIDYRLSPQVKHPTHIHDVIENLYKLITEFKITSFQLLGHSVGATLAWQVCTCNCVLFPFKAKLDVVQSRLTGIYLVDGIYSLVELLDEYPSYNYFVSQAFNDSDKDFEEIKLSIDRLPSHISSIHLLHSYNDELLTLRQTRYISTLLQEAHLPFTAHFSDMGLHNDVYSNAKLANYILNSVKFT